MFQGAVGAPQEQSNLNAMSGAFSGAGGTQFPYSVQLTYEQQQEQQFPPVYQPQPIPTTSAGAVYPNAGPASNNNDDASGMQRADLIRPSVLQVPQVLHQGVASPSQKAKKQNISVAIKDLSYIVDLPPPAKGEPAEKKQLLKDLSLTFNSGRLTVLMGASGAGKTTLMQCIAGDVNTGTVYGSVLLNGEPVKHTVLQKASAFVYQDDCILGTASVLESITMSAHLRLPQETTPEERQQRIDQTIKILNLGECKNTLIGSHTIRGVSGGERKRCAVGMELVTDPPILFIDEGTSGLDTKNALQLVRTLRDLARDGHTVITTMHQPSSEIFHLFDDLIILAKGEVIFSGPAEWAVEYFATLGFQCPRYTNPADYFFTTVINSEDEAVSSAERSAFLIESWKQRGAQFTASKTQQEVGTVVAMSASPLKSAMTEIPLSSPGSAPLTAAAVESVLDRPGFGVQFDLLFRRAFRNQLRNRLLLRGKAAQTIIMSVVVGLVYLQIGNNQKSVQDRQGFLFFVVANSVMSAAMAVLSTFHGERPVFIREHGSGMYSLGAYFMSKVATEIPILLITPLVSSSILYWMVGLQPHADKFFIYYCTAAFMQLCGNAIGFFVASIFNDPNAALQVLPLFLMPLMLFSGFMINDDSIPVYLFWLKYLSPMKYGLVTLVRNEFSGLTLTCDPNAPCSYQNGDEVVTAMGFDHEQTIWQNLVILAAFFLGLMIMSCGALWKIGSKIGMAKYVQGPVPAEVMQKVEQSLQFHAKQQSPSPQDASAKV